MEQHTISVDRITGLPNNSSARYRLRITTNHWTFGQAQLLMCLAALSTKKWRHLRLLVAD
jgi:hypothetical protein